MTNEKGLLNEKLQIRNEKLGMHQKSKGFFPFHFSFLILKNFSFLISNF